jgi:hypothetical protein
VCSALQASFGTSQVFVGFGHWLPLAAVSSGWLKAYKATIKRPVYIQKILSSYDSSSNQLSFSEEVYDVRHTSYSAVCEYLSSLTMAQQHGLDFGHDGWRLQRIAGRKASNEVLILAHNYGMPFSHQVMIGAIESGSINTLQWLHNEQGCAITSDLSYFAAASGYIHVLNWLLPFPQCVFDSMTSLNAARGGHLHVLKYLSAKGTAIDVRACAAAARLGALDMLQWFDEARINWKHQSVYTAAAECGSMEIILWLTERGAVFDTQTMKAAAKHGYLDICKHLRSQGCHWDDHVTFAAKTLEILKWLHENGCPWDVDMTLLMMPDRPIRKYVIAESGTSVSKLSELLNLAGIEFNSYIGKRLREEGAKWPNILKYGRQVWKPEMIEWARSQGCTSPTS